MTEPIPHYIAHSAAYPPPVDNTSTKYQAILDKVPDVEPEPYDEIPSSTWQYRVSQQTMQNGSVVFAIREFYGADCKGWTKEEIAPIGDSVKDLRWVLTKMLEALGKPVIDIGEYDNGIGQPN